MGCLLALSATRMISRSNNCMVRLAISRCPLVIGSKVPGYSATCTGRLLIRTEEPGRALRRGPGLRRSVGVLLRVRLIRRRRGVRRFIQGKRRAAPFAVAYAGQPAHP